MPYRIHHHAAVAFIAVELSGVVRWYDVAAVLSAVYKHTAKRHGYRLLWDARALELVDIAPQGFMEIASAVRSYLALGLSGRSALLLHRNADRTVAESIAAHLRSPDHVVAIVDELQAALDFLGLSALPDANEGAGPA